MTQPEPERPPQSASAAERDQGSRAGEAPWPEEAWRAGAEPGAAWPESDAAPRPAGQPERGGPYAAPPEGGPPNAARPEDGAPHATVPEAGVPYGGPPRVSRFGWRGKDPWWIWLRQAEEAAAGRVADIPVPAWLRRTRGERRWPISLSVAAAIVLEILLPPKFTEPLPGWLLPAMEGVLLIGLTVADPVRVERGGTAMRAASIVQIFLVTLANAVSAVLLIRSILDGQAGSAAEPLFATGASIWATNVIAFGLWYWEFDRGGPIRRMEGARRFPDLMFPQMASPELAPRDWEPHFFDYLYLSFTNATAFSPTDVMPLARWAKLTMLVQSAVSLAIGALVIARAVNILRT
jgi:uncharacterized membrane protein